MVLRMEKICSMTFAFPISIVITFFFFTFYLGLLILIYVWLDLNFFVIYLILMGSMMLFQGHCYLQQNQNLNFESAPKIWFQ